MLQLVKSLVDFRFTLVSAGPEQLRLAKSSLKQLTQLVMRLFEPGFALSKAKLELALM